MYRNLSFDIFSIVISMKSTIDRYNKIKEENNNMNPMSEVKVT